MNVVNGISWSNMMGILFGIDLQVTLWWKEIGIQVEVEDLVLFRTADVVAFLTNCDNKEKMKFIKVLSQLIV
jgi:hypothetical protein